jgi:hypothetical protein
VCESPLQIVQYFSGAESLDPLCRLTLMQTTELYDLSFKAYLPLFLLTCLFEAPFYFIFLRGRSFTSRLSALLLCNLATHPIVCFVIPKLAERFQLTLASELAIAEIFAPAIEALLLWKVWRMRLTTALIAAVLANLFSWWVGIYLS